MVLVSCVGLLLGRYAFSNFLCVLPLVVFVIYAFNPVRPLVHLHRDLDLWSKFHVLACLYVIMPLLTFGFSAFTPVMPLCI